MTDIADKIYAATGLTLNAEAAAAIERLIKAENEKLRAENEHLATSNHAYLSGYQEAIAEIEKLRAALGEKE
jgi:cell division protein FtsB